MKKDNKLIFQEDWDAIFKKFPENNFSNHAFPLYLFTQRLYDSLVKSNCKDVIFMSREGQFLKLLFEVYCDIRKELKQPVTEIKTHYFYGSRNSVMTASVKPIEEESFELMFRFFNFFISPRRFLYSIGFSDKQIDTVRKTFGKRMNKSCFSFKNSRSFKKLKQNEDFKSIYEENRNKQCNSFKLYMNSFNIDYNNEGLTFVDIGYHGTMQDLIFKFFDEKVNITGYFIKSRATQVDKNLKFGLLGDNDNKKLFGSKINKYDSFNYEQILRADHGRCLGYQSINEKSATPLIDEEHQDKETYDKYVKAMQDQILEKFKLIANKCITENISPENICTIYYYYTIKNKTKTDLNWILDMQDNHHDDFGYVGYPGRAFARKLRTFAFRLKDKVFLFANKSYIKKLKKQEQAKV